MSSGKEKNTIALTVLYLAFSFVYLIVFDHRFQLKGLLNCGLTIALPIPYILGTIVFIYLYAYLSGRPVRTIAMPLTAMAISLPILYLLTELKIESIAMNPFRGNRGIYNIYLEGYYLVCMSIFSMASGNIARKLLRGDTKLQGMVLHAPIFIYFAVIEGMLVTSGLMIYPLTFFLLFLIASTSDIIDGFFKATRVISLKIANDERTFVVLIFILAFAIRYFWGARLMDLTGANFIRASDDGEPYDSMAATLTGGGVLPKDAVFGLNGFGYWHFLAAIYKVFGLHNFKAIMVIQACLNASVPVFVYLAGKRIFSSKPIGALAGMIVCFNMTLIFLSVVIGMEALYIPLFYLAVTWAAYLLTAEKGLSRMGAFILGSAFGLANNARGELLFAPFVLAFAAMIYMKNKARARDIVFTAALIFLGFAIFASIQHIVNYNIYGEYRLMQSTVETNFIDKRFTDENAILDKMGFNPFKDMNSSAGFFLRRPIFTSWLLLKGFVKRTLIYYLQPNFGVFDPLFLVNPASGYLFRFPLYLQFLGYLFILAGLIMAFREGSNIAAKAMLIMIILYISSIYIMILLQNSRNRGVLIPIAILFLAYGVSALCRGLKRAYSN